MTTLGTPAFMLARTEGPDTSHAAARSVDTTNLEGMVLEAYRQAGTRGLTQDELLDLFPGFSYSSITARPSALKRKFLIVDNGEKREGKSGRQQSVLIAAESEGVLFGSPDQPSFGPY